VDQAEIEDTNKAGPNNNAGRGDAKDAPVRPWIDSYRPSYSNHQRQFMSDGPIIQPTPRPNFHNVRKDLKLPVVLDTREQQAGPSYNHNHNKKSGGGQGRGQPVPQGIPRGPKNPHTQNNNPPSQNSARKTPAWSQANGPNQTSGADTPHWYSDKPCWYQTTPNNRGQGAKTPAHTQDNTLHGGFGGRTPGRFDNNGPSQSWGGGTPHTNQQAR
jgi:hypothetical protein